MRNNTRPQAGLCYALLEEETRYEEELARNHRESQDSGAPGPAPSRETPDQDGADARRAGTGMQAAKRDGGRYAA